MLKKILIKMYVDASKTVVYKNTQLRYIMRHHKTQERQTAK